MTENIYNKKFWLFFVLAIVIMRIVTFLIQKYSDNEPILFLEIIGSVAHIVVVVVFLKYFKCLYIIKNSLIFSKKKQIRNWEILFSSLLIFLFIFIVVMYPNPMHILLNKYTIGQICVTFSEELFFRVFILGVLLHNIRLYNIESTLNKKNICKILISLAISSFLFAFWHIDFWHLENFNFFNFIERFNKSLIFYGMPFMVTNKKIWPGWLLHYINNMIGFLKRGII